MRPRRPVVFAAAVLASLASGAELAALAEVAAAHPAGSHAPCSPAGSVVMVSDSRARVYKLAGTVYGCELRSGRRTRLGKATLCVGAARVDRAALAADLVAYGLERCGVDTGSASVVVLNLSNGARRSADAAITGLIPVEAYQSVDSLLVKRDGSVAWIATVRSIIGRGTGIEVHAVQHQRSSLLDSGPGIVSSSLRLQGSKLTWRHGTSTRSATLR